MFERITRYCTLEGILETRTAFRVGTERVPSPVGTEHPVLRDDIGQPFIPGASLKGALRNHLEAYARGVTGNRTKLVACNPVGFEESRCITPNDLRQIKAENASGIELAEALWDKTCLLCRTFGAPWLASAVEIADSQVIQEQWIGHFEVRNGVAIDRDKGTAAHQRLYDYEAVPAGTAFSLHITAHNLTHWQLGLLWLGIRDLAAGQIPIGSMSGRGLGWIQLSEFQFTVIDSKEILTWLAGKAGGQTLTTPDNPVAQPWVRALRTELAAASSED